MKCFTKAAQAWLCLSAVPPPPSLVHQKWISGFHMTKHRAIQRIKVGEEVVWVFAFIFDLSMYLRTLYSTEAIVSICPHHGVRRPLFPIRHTMQRPQNPRLQGKWSVVI
ncbi:uncharacterized protein LY89DRAFT_462934 [Mollisia scopiformis]|uniref:Uncharacterized protein n=1 Tax=Mollisia scopiformis TaxID=149040 RepID=A0A194XHZ9_MOLSC|nr:uncharacterized protein LY89DRAFT_462934 [Mollisia scopiformis]KUJ19845.1 hypothetical protein LY89DRAFT_462934 [Mollisia scopiformis]